jgi:serine/threonine-protein kinase
MTTTNMVRDYVLEEVIGEGGMGKVWRAHHTTLKKVFAVKVMSDILLNKPDFEARFQQEAQAQAKLQHPSILSVTDFFSENGAYYLVMPFIEGKSLDARLDEQKGPLPPAEVLSISKDVLSALDYAHQKGIIHRDVKPSNILLDKSGHAFLVDFGIALMVGQERKTRTGTTIGTPYYMSPEQIRRPKEIDHRTDVYSFGCVLYEMLTGHTPFEVGDEEGDSDFIIKDGHLNKMPRPLRHHNINVPAAIEAVVMRALAKDPNMRFSGCGEFARALAEAVAPTETITCKTCGAQNQVAKDRPLAEARCGKCGNLLTAAPVKGPKTRSSAGWIAATISLLIAALIAVVGWAVTYEKLAKERDINSDNYWKLTSYDAEVNKRKELEAKLAAERDFRKKIAQDMPVSVTEVKLRNEDKGGNQIGLIGYTTKFYQSSARFISCHFTLRNNAAGIEDAQGRLGIDFVKPDGTIITFPNGSSVYTFVFPLRISESVSDSRGLGHENGNYFTPGSYKVRIYWDGKRLSETSFEVLPDASTSSSPLFPWSPR